MGDDSGFKRKDLRSPLDDRDAIGRPGRHSDGGNSGHSAQHRRGVDASRPIDATIGADNTDLHIQLLAERDRNRPQNVASGSIGQRLLTTKTCERTPNQRCAVALKDASVDRRRPAQRSDKIDTRHPDRVHPRLDRLAIGGNGREGRFTNEPSIRRAVTEERHLCARRKTARIWKGQFGAGVDGDIERRDLNNIRTVISNRKIDRSSPVLELCQVD